ncbi:CPBP family intramembrane glutamic endopeptidase [Corynebacterium sp. NPDC060344]|uniref:CPBP family intramembrane glutamic endopeptidase n=1 Tax=Corynebacterium sp. NPDC060344 TaxID=3347101 RepID=UPI003649E750
MEKIKTKGIGNDSRAQFFTRPGSTREGYGWGRIIAAFVVLAVAIALLSVIGGLIAAAVAPIDESGRANSTAGQILHLTLPVASWWLAVIGVARFMFGMRFGDLISHTRRIRWGLLGSSLLVGLIGFAASAAIITVLKGQSFGSVTGPVALALVAIVLLVPLQASAEEVLFRGFAIQTVLGKLGWSTKKFWIVAFVFSAGFAAAHATSDVATGVSYVLFALLFAWLAWRFAGIEAAIGVHVANNVISLAFGVLRGEDLLGNQSDVAASMLHLAIQLGFAALICFVVVVIARRSTERAH